MDSPYYGTMKAVPGIKAAHAIVTDQCRATKGAEEAFEEALGRLWAQAVETSTFREESDISEDVNYHFVLYVEAVNE